MLRSAARDVSVYLKAQHTHRSLNAFIKLAAQDATKPTHDADSSSSTDGPLRGSLIAIKDNICTNDLPTTAASRALKSFTSPFDATVVSKLREAGAVIAGKTNLDEFGMGSHSLHSHHGAVYQEKDGVKLSAGGSSGGSAVAVATGQCEAALGTDTGGSVRLPAAYNGIVGFKPSYGLLSRWGVIAYANSLDTVGILSQTPKVAHTIFDALNHHDEQDPTSLNRLTRARMDSLAQGDQNVSWSSLRIGVPQEYNIKELSPSVRKAWVDAIGVIRSLGASVIPVSLSSTRQALSAYYVLAPAEASSNLAKYDGVRYGFRADGADKTPDSVLYAKTRGEAFGEEVKRRILLGAYTLSANAIDNYFIQAQKVRRLVQRDFDAVFRHHNPLLNDQSSHDQVSNDPSQVDLLLCPTAPTPPPTLKEVEQQRPVDAYINDVFTVPASLAGLPALSIPSSPHSHIGMQLIGQFGDDRRVLLAAQALFDTLTAR